MTDSEHPFTSEYSQPRRKHNFLVATALRALGSSSFEGGELDNPAGVIRVLSAHSSAYLVPINSEATNYCLIDAGMDKKAKQILAELALKDLGADAVKAILLTHGHTDHTSGIRAFPEADVYVGQPDDDFVAGRTQGDGPVGRLIGTRADLAIVNPDKLHVLKDAQQVIAIGDKMVQVFAVPGHTRGSVVCVIDNALYAGDALTFNTKGAVNKPPAPVSHDVGMAVASLKRLVGTLDTKGIASDITTVIPSHSGQGSFDAVRKFVSQS